MILVKHTGIALVCCFCLFTVNLFGSFGLSAKEPFTVMLCPSSVSTLVFSASHRIKYRNFIFGTDMHLYTLDMHIKYLVILAIVVK